jgi:archaetidylinositol phosphate synthase
MSTTEFNEAQRVSTSLIVSLERRCLQRLAVRLPACVNSDHLTGLALVAMLLTGASFVLAREHPAALLMVPLWLAANWFGDSLDGTVARVRGHQRPRYGFYVDHVVDCFGVLFVFGGLALSGYMSPPVAMAVVIAYFLVSIEVYLATYCLTVFKLSFWGIGPTELRLVLGAGSLALLSDPQVTLLGRTWRLFDLGGVVGVVGLAVTVVVAVVQNTRALYRAEPLPGSAVAAQ